MIELKSPGQKKSTQENGISAEQRRIALQALDAAGYNFEEAADATKRAFPGTTAEQRRNIMRQALKA